MSNCCSGPYGCGNPTCGYGPTEAQLKSREAELCARPYEHKSKHRVARIQRAKAKAKAKAKKRRAK